MNNNTNNHKGGIKIDIVITVILAALKLAGIINWAWIWIVSPIWICVLLVYMLDIILRVMDYLKKRKVRKILDKYGLEYDIKEGIIKKEENNEN